MMEVKSSSSSEADGADGGLPSKDPPVTEGCCLPVRDSGLGYVLADIIKIRFIDGIKVYYVHYVDYNGVFDEWLPEEYLGVWNVGSSSRKKKRVAEASSSTSNKIGATLTSGTVGHLPPLLEGCCLPVRNPGLRYVPAKIMKIQVVDGIRKYYVHYKNYNKEFDQWIPEEYLDIDNIISRPRKKKTVKPKKVSRACSSTSNERAEISSGTMIDHLLLEGYRLPVHKPGLGYVLAEVKKIHVVDGSKRYHVHYVDSDNKVDECVSEEYLDILNISSPPRKRKRVADDPQYV